MKTYPLTPKGYEEVHERMDALIAKKYKNCDPQGNGGLGDEEQKELEALFAWNQGALAKVSDYYQDFCRLKKGDVVEATFDDGVIYARISEEFNGGCYHIQTLEGGGGCTIKPHRVRKLSPLEVFNLGVNL
jgi:hypothetical protein